MAERKRPMMSKKEFENQGKSPETEISELSEEEKELVKGLIKELKDKIGNEAPPKLSKDLATNPAFFKAVIKETAKKITEALPEFKKFYHILFMEKDEVSAADESKKNKIVESFGLLTIMNYVSQEFSKQSISIGVLTSQEEDTIIEFIKICYKLKRIFEDSSILSKNSCGYGIVVSKDSEHMKLLLETTEKFSKLAVPESKRLTISEKPKDLKPSEDELNETRKSLGIPLKSASQEKGAAPSWFTKPVDNSENTKQRPPLSREEFWGVQEKDTSATSAQKQPGRQQTIIPGYKSVGNDELPDTIQRKSAEEFKEFLTSQMSKKNEALNESIKDFIYIINRKADKEKILEYRMIFGVASGEMKEYYEINVQRGNVNNLLEIIKTFERELPDFKLTPYIQDIHKGEVSKPYSLRQHYQDEDKTNDQIIDSLGLNLPIAPIKTESKSKDENPVLTHEPNNHNGESETEEEKKNKENAEKMKQYLISSAKRKKVDEGEISGFISFIETKLQKQPDTVEYRLSLNPEGTESTAPLAISLFVKRDDRITGAKVEYINALLNDILLYEKKEKEIHPEAKTNPNIINPTKEEHPAKTDAERVLECLNDYAIRIRWSRHCLNDLIDIIKAYSTEKKNATEILLTLDSAIAGGDYSVHLFIEPSKEQKIEEQLKRLNNLMDGFLTIKRITNPELMTESSPSDTTEEAEYSKKSTANRKPSDERWDDPPAFGIGKENADDSEPVETTTGPAEDIVAPAAKDTGHTYMAESTAPWDGFALPEATPIPADPEGSPVYSGGTKFGTISQTDVDRMKNINSIYEEIIWRILALGEEEITPEVVERVLSASEDLGIKYISGMNTYVIEYDQEGEKTFRSISYKGILYQLQKHLDSGAETTRLNLKGVQTINYAAAVAYVASSAISLNGGRFFIAAQLIEQIRKKGLKTVLKVNQEHDGVILKTQMELAFTSDRSMADLVLGFDKELVSAVFSIYLPNGQEISIEINPAGGERIQL